jgi:hypothetical protein
MLARRSKRASCRGCAIARHTAAPTLHGLTTAGEAVFCKQSGCSLDEWREWLAKQESIRDGNQKSGGLNIPWLPDSMDLDELLQADDAAQEGSIIE